MARNKQIIADDITAAGGTPPTDLNTVTAQELEDQLAQQVAANQKVARGELTEAQAQAQLGYSDADDDGHRWKTVQEDKQVRVYLLDRHGRGYDTLVKDEATGQAFLKTYAAQQQ